MSSITELGTGVKPCCPQFAIVSQMKLVVISFLIFSAVEACIWSWQLKRYRRVASSLLAMTVLVWSVIACWYIPGFVAIGLLLISVYRAINLRRSVQNRLHINYLLASGRRAFLWLGASQLGLLALVIAKPNVHFNTQATWYALGIVQLGSAMALIFWFVRNSAAARPSSLLNNYPTRDLPTLTVAIPARNETTELEACLQSLVASSYPKLEILVLDDCSQNKRTPEIIRGYAHEGVRFIAGNLPPDDWLAKNYAYHRLVEEANGELLLFCGVDTRFEPDSLTTIVKAMLDKKKVMVSILPQNQLPPLWPLEASMAQAGRYAWELALPRHLAHRPPVLSTCWIINHSELDKHGGFSAVTRANEPERYFARQCSISGDDYGFLIADSAIGLSSNKNFDQQQNTAMRTRYPQLHKHIELVLLVSFIEFVILVSPFCLLLAALQTQFWPVAIICALACATLLALYMLIVRLTYRRTLWRALWLMPLAALYDIGLLHYSMWQYEFGEVIWKGRNICLPVMQAIPSLPRLKN